MGKKRTEDSLRRKDSGQFARLPLQILQTRQFALLSAHATKLLMDLISECRLGRNGDLSVAWTVMKERGWRSRDTLRKAQRELIDKRWIVQTRQGGRNRCSLFAITIWPLDPSSKYDILPKDFEKGEWAKVPAYVWEAPSRKSCPAQRVKQTLNNTPAVLSA